MDSADLSPLIEDLSSNIDDLEEALAPLLKTPLRDASSKLPLLDKAKLNVFTTYAIESIIFSYLNLSSEDAKAHPVFTELSRVKEYFAKVKLAEEGPAQRPDNRTLDKVAANRFIKHGLSGNEQYDKERAERLEREKQSAKIKFDELTEKMEMERLAIKRKAEEAAAKAAAAAEDDDSSSDSSDSESKGEESKGDASKSDESKGEDGEAKTQKQKRNWTYKQRKEEKLLRGEEPRTRRKRKSSDATSKDKAGPSPKSSRKRKSDQAPRGPGEAFKALLEGSTPAKDESEKPPKKKTKRGKKDKSES